MRCRSAMSSLVRQQPDLEKQIRVHAVSSRRAKHRPGRNGCGSGSKRAARDHQRVPFLWREPRSQERQWKEREGLCSECLDSRGAAVIANRRYAIEFVSHWFYNITGFGGRALPAPVAGR